MLQKPYESKFQNRYKYHHSVRNNENCGRKSSTADTITLHASTNIYNEKYEIYKIECNAKGRRDSKE